ncbi:hypothetical protein DRO91_07535 [Candidatus Heimdallarchaeota archaeon]|nr:MAG: hypothetical protein DRO91_07535 [Candidatus Heimdallarchaeota archaeon]
MLIVRRNKNKAIKNYPFLLFWPSIKSLKITQLKKEKIRRNFPQKKLINLPKQKKNSKRNTYRKLK